MFESSEQPEIINLDSGLAGAGNAFEERKKKERGNSVKAIGLYLTPPQLEITNRFPKQGFCACCAKQDYLPAYQKIS